MERLGPAVGVELEDLRPPAGPRPQGPPAPPGREAARPRAGRGRSRSRSRNPASAARRAEAPRRRPCPPPSARAGRGACRSPGAPRSPARSASAPVGTARAPPRATAPPEPPALRSGRPCPPSRRPTRGWTPPPWLRRSRPPRCAPGAGNPEPRRTGSRGRPPAPPIREAPAPARARTRASPPPARGPSPPCGNRRTIAGDARPRIAPPERARRRRARAGAREPPGRSRPLLVLVGAPDLDEGGAQTRLHRAERDPVGLGDLASGVDRRSTRGRAAASRRPRATRARGSQRRARSGARPRRRRGPRAPRPSARVRPRDACVAPERSTARLCAIVMSHVDRRPREGSNRAALRHAARKTSWVNSSAASGLPSRRRPRVKIGRAYRAYSMRTASSSTGKQPLHQLLLLACEERSFGPSVHPVSFRYTGSGPAGAWRSDGHHATPFAGWAPCPFPATGSTVRVG